MWERKEVIWPNRLIEAAQSKKLVLFVGNGISRLSGAPGWTELFNETVIRNHLKAIGINTKRDLQGEVSLPELAEIVRQNRAAGNSIYNRLRDWNTNAEINEIHTILKELEPMAIITTNFDTLLEKAEIKESIIRYLHGRINQGDLILAQWGYFEKLEEARKLILSYVQNSGAYVLFLGYGHSYDDVDVLLALYDLANTLEGKGHVFSLISSRDNTPIKKARLESYGIETIEYQLPANPDRQTRVLGLGMALLELCSDEQRRQLDNVIKIFESYKKKLEERNRQTSIVIGLASVNRIAEPESFPKPARLNIRGKNDEQEEAGGPGVIVARVLAALGYPAALVSRIAYDNEGDIIWNTLTSLSEESAALLDLDYLERIDPDLEGIDPFWTWRSYVLIDPDERGQRIFFDRTVPIGKLKLGDKCSKSVIGAIQKYQPPIIYFDKFNPDTLSSIIPKIEHPSIPNKEKIWTVYETGSKGDKEYYTEKHIIDGRVNIVIASFKFARDFLAKAVIEAKDTISTSGIDLWNKLAGGKDTTAKEETEIISRLLGDYSLLEQFVGFIRQGADLWLRKNGPRLVVITLHEEGSMWILLQPEKSGVVRLREVVTNKWYTNSAGDVFRGGFVAALLESRRQGLTFNDADTLNSICSVSNEIAALKVTSPTVGVALQGIKKTFENWKKSEVPILCAKIKF